MILLLTLCVCWNVCRTAFFVFEFLPVVAPKHWLMSLSDDRNGALINCAGSSPAVLYVRITVVGHVVVACVRAEM